jgi:integrase
VASPEEIKTLLEKAPPDLALLARLTLESLLQLSEALALRREDIGPTSVTVIQGKSGRARQVPISVAMRAGLLARCHASGSVFGVGKAGTPPRSGTVSWRFARLTTGLGVPGLSHHVLRHTGATVMVRNGVSLRAVQTIGGWSSLRMLERYAHVNDAELARAVHVTQAHTAAAIDAPTKTPTVAKTATDGGGGK